MPDLTATLVIDLLSSRCGHCGEPTLLRDSQGDPITHHRDVSGYNPKPGGGCGARFIDTAPGHSAVTGWHLRHVRPDLPVHGMPGTEVCEVCDADDPTTCGCCPACDTPLDERCVACGRCRCDTHPTCTRNAEASR